MASMDMLPDGLIDLEIAKLTRKRPTKTCATCGHTDLKVNMVKSYEGHWYCMNYMECLDRRTE